MTTDTKPAPQCCHVEDSGQQSAPSGADRESALYWATFTAVAAFADTRPPAYLAGIDFRDHATTALR